MAEVEIGIGKSGRQAYGLDDVAIVPSRRTRDPEDVDISWEIDAFSFGLPMMAAAMDGVVSPATAIEIGHLGGVGVLNLEGLWTRYENPEPLLTEIAELPAERATARMQEIYLEPVKTELVRAAHPRDQRGRCHRLRLGHAPAGVGSLLGRARGRARPPRHPGHGRLRRARLEERRAAQLEAVHPRDRHPCRRRAAAPPIPPRCTSCGPVPRGCSSASAPATPAPPAGCSASACRRRPPSPTRRGPGRAISRRPGSMCT